MAQNANKGQMQVTLKIDDEKIASALISAFEGGSNYWYQIESVRKPRGEQALWKYREDSGRVYPHIDYPMNPTGHLIISSLEEPEKGKFKLTRRRIEQGLQKLAESKDYGHHFRDLASDDGGDQVTGDVLLQFCLFGDVIYG
jgi:hypothetical protein